MRLLAVRSLAALASTAAVLLAAVSPAAAAQPVPLASSSGSSAPAAATPTPPGVSPTPLGSPNASDALLPKIGRVRATTAFCRTIVDHGAALADDQLADIATTTEALRILVYAPLDRSFFMERRAARALQTLSDRLMASRRGEARLHVAGLRSAALGGSGEPARPELARFAGALDGAHAESSRVAHDLARVLSVLMGTEGAGSGVYLPDLQMNRDPRFARAIAPVPFPVDPELERSPPTGRSTTARFTRTRGRQRSTSRPPSKRCSARSGKPRRRIPPRTRAATRRNPPVRRRVPRKKRRARVRPG